MPMGDSGISFVHIVWSGDAFFNDRIIHLITSEKCLSPEKHVFLTNRQDFYDRYRQNACLKYEPELSGAKLINKAFAIGYWVFVHGMCGPDEVLKIRKDCLNRIIWRTWGHDIRPYRLKHGQLLKNVIKWYLNKRYIYRGNHIFFMGGNNEIDMIAIRRTFANSKFVRVPYPDPQSFDIIHDVKKSNEGKRKKVGEKTRILVGHSGISNDNHIRIIQNVKNISTLNDIELIFVLSYGDPDYICLLEDYIEQNVKQCSIIIRDKLSFREYNELLASVDIAILDGTESYALDNISSLLYFEKIIVLNPSGVIAQAFQEYGLPYYTLDDLKNIIFEKDNNPMDYNMISQTTLGPQTYEHDVDEWMELLKALHKMCPTGDK